MLPLVPVFCSPPSSWHVLPLAPDPLLNVPRSTAAPAVGRSRADTVWPPWGYIAARSFCVVPCAPGRFSASPPPLLSSTHGGSWSRHDWPKHRHPRNTRRLTPQRPPSAPPSRPPPSPPPLRQTGEPRQMPPQPSAARSTASVGRACRVPRLPSRGGSHHRPRRPRPPTVTQQQAWPAAVTRSPTV